MQKRIIQDTMQKRIVGMTALAMGVALSLSACSEGTQTDAASQGGAALSSPGDAALKCKTTALDAASAIDALGWGKVTSEQLTFVSGTRDELERSEQINVRSTVSGYTYAIAIYQDYRSEACIIQTLGSGSTAAGFFGGNATDVKCMETALAAASKVDELGWGKVTSEPLKVLSGTRDDEQRSEQFTVKSTVSGYTYTVSLTQDARSEACIIQDLR